MAYGDLGLGACVPRETALLFALWPNVGETQGNNNADSHRDEAEEQERSRCAEVHPNHDTRSAKESDEGSAAADTREEDAHHKQSADAA